MKAVPGLVRLHATQKGGGATWRFINSRRQLVYFDPQGRYRKARTAALAYVESCLAASTEPINRSTFRVPEPIAGQMRANFLPLIRKQLPDLVGLSDESSGPAFQDMIYRYYHGSFQVWKLQPWVGRCVLAFGAVFPGIPINGLYCEIVHSGLREILHSSFNRTWSQHARQVVDAALHTQLVLGAVVRIAKSTDQQVPQALSPDWGIALSLWNLR